jgi:ribosomal protein S12 methylthiotransferase
MKIHFVSLGCDKNTADSEVMLAQLWGKGYSFTDDEAAADVIVIVTCCFIHDAKQESIETILRLAAYKESGCCQALVVAGCLSERYRAELQQEIPEVDAIIGVNEIERIAEIVAGVVAAAPEPRDRTLPDEGGKSRILTTGGHYAYLKIAEGCDKHCTYCIIPMIRGPYRSVPMEDLLTDTVNMVRDGVKELILVAQETTLYGVDLYGRKMLPELLQKLAEIEGLRWIRLLYCYPEEITDELIAVIKNEKKVCHYLDIPIQHGNNEILRRMGRKTNRMAITGLVAKLREEIPDICLRTTLITGFPGEGKAEHEDNLRLIESLRFDRLGVFTYSPEEDTPAATMPKQVSERTKKRRYAELMGRQQEIAFARAAEMVSRELTVMIEGQMEECDGNIYVARTYRDAPDIDGYLFLENERSLMSGDFVEVVVTAAEGYDLCGRSVGE